LKAIQNNSQYFGNKYSVALFVIGAVVYLAVNISLSRLAVWLQGRSTRTAAPAVIVDASATRDQPAGAPTGTA
jgi:glutamate transport system permease protein